MQAFVHHGMSDCTVEKACMYANMLMYICLCLCIRTYVYTYNVDSICVIMLFYVLIY